MITRVKDNSDFLQILFDLKDIATFYFGLLVNNFLIIFGKFCHAFELSKPNFYHMIYYLVILIPN